MREKQTTNVNEIKLPFSAFTKCIMHKNLQGTLYNRKLVIRDATTLKMEIYLHRYNAPPLSLLTITTITSSSYIEYRHTSTVYTKRSCKGGNNYDDGDDGNDDKLTLYCELMQECTVVVLIASFHWFMINNGDDVNGI